MSLAEIPGVMPKRAALVPTDQMFHLFSSLPAELRLKIWEYNLPEPRVVTVECGCRSESLFSPSPPIIDRPWCTSPAVIPVNLHVCHESRTEALRRYSRMFGIARRPGHVYFDGSRDVLYFGSRPGYMASEAQLRTLLSLADPDELRRVQRVALNEALFWEGTNRAADTGGVILSAEVPVLLSPPPPQPEPTSSSFQIAISVAVDMMHLLRTRMPCLKELILVPRGAIPSANIDADPVPLTENNFASHPRHRDTHTTAAIAYLGLQAQAAMRRMQTTRPGWSPPPWKILAMAGNCRREAFGPTFSLDEPELGSQAGYYCPSLFDSQLPRATCSASYLGQGFAMAADPGFRQVASPAFYHHRHHRLPSLAAAFPYGSHGVVLPPAVATSFSRVNQTIPHFMMQFRDLEE